MKIIAFVLEYISVADVAYNAYYNLMAVLYISSKDIW